MNPNDEVFKTLMKLVEKEGVKYVLDNVHKAQIAVDKHKNLLLSAEYRISGLQYTDKVEIDETVSTYSQFWLSSLLRKVTETIKALEKTNLGILTVSLAIYLHKGDNKKFVASISLLRDWVVEEPENNRVKNLITDDYAKLKGV